MMVLQVTHRLPLQQSDVHSAASLRLLLVILKVLRDIGATLTTGEMIPQMPLRLEQCQLQVAVCISRIHGIWCMT